MFLDRKHMCAVDPVVLAEVAKLSVVITATFGTLSCLTTAWWGSVWIFIKWENWLDSCISLVQLSDRYGRTRILTFCIFGMIMTDLSFIVVYHFYKILPGGYWFILLGPVLDGLLGGTFYCVSPCQYLTELSRYHRMSSCGTSIFRRLYTSWGSVSLLQYFFLRFS